MVARNFGYITRKLSDLNFLNQVPLECGKEDLTLRWLEAIHHAGNRTLHIIPREKNELLVDEVRDGDVGLRLVQLVSGLEVEQPGLALIRTRLVERSVDELARVFGPPKDLHERLEVLEVLLGIFGCACSETLEILDRPFGTVGSVLLPTLIVRKTVKLIDILTTTCHHDGSGKLLQEPWDGEEAGELGVEEVHNEGGNVGPVNISISHKHDRAITQR
ncbi:hypothetical protein FR483_n554L [Paramecium bursaria Chlorella virus FR483]|uniref:Uncharacterized protein n554L n=1 Tax=Paramecium bursaria Chlorella virus FR483 TaxID=399781 RepID=A7J7Q8_PBCVF|nr:hypothetical protein FR483_n554L [Paramecium bursaria Chlorella virus FR483]ABT15839.1 hypothetical protein FR483_n554L [Paramecium bursaria Chlorella virus FR483]